MVDSSQVLLENIVFAGSNSFDDSESSNQKVEAGKATAGHVHLRIQQRNGRKCLTIVQGLADDLDMKKILKALKKTYSTNGTVLVDKEHGEIIQLQGDQRKNVYEFLTKCNICSKEEIKTHGF